jgi:hypothetical protein
MKKSCDNYRAINSYGCGLGYKTDITRNGVNGYPSARKPSEECEKPKTFKEFIWLLDIKRQKLCKDNQ